ncbi:hypothetical protein [Mesorhizobium sp. CA5]|uniref:hypothetical protein n=1 Tax=Mesorhizobium sp. CA5 TaxID=2876638 RepID=UPI001CD0B342|nr:hypothetical protein [Mesorhizobium sp. CA5]MBZ9843372.1 hypothetical protein [Mesorhizobium sp. CA5]
MAKETSSGPRAPVPANDNGDVVNSEARTELMPAAKLNRVVLDIARLMGRQLAREAFDAGEAANDNRPGHQRGEGREPDGKPLGNKREDLPP